MIAFDLQIISSLEVEPEAIARPEVPSEPERRIGGDGSRPVHNLIDAARGHTNVLSQSVLRNTERLEKIEREYFARMDRREFARSCHSYRPSVSAYLLLSVSPQSRHHTHSSARHRTGHRLR